MTIDWKLVIAFWLAALSAGCVVEPPLGASNETISGYNTLIIGLYGLIATAVIGLVAQIVGIWMNRRAIVAANHQNEKLMALTESLAETDKKARGQDSEKGAGAVAGVPVAPIVVVVPLQATTATPNGKPVPVKVTNGLPIPVTETKRSEP